jgi:hypothetical protein
MIEENNLEDNNEDAYKNHTPKKAKSGKTNKHLHLTPNTE